MTRIFISFLSILFVLSANAQSNQVNSQIHPVKEQAKIVNDILSDRIQASLPKLMDESGLDCWVLISREYNEDPILKTFLPAEWLSARRRTILVFYRDKAKATIESYAIARYPVGKSIKAAWNPDIEPNQWKALANLIKKIQPQKIGVNTSKDFGHADGIDFTEFEQFKNSLDPLNLSKIVSAEKLGIAWLETRIEKEMALYPSILSITHQIIKEGFSNKVVKPNYTTTNDLVWWFRQKVSDLGLSTWFHPSVEIQRRDSLLQDEIIRPGDLLHVDFGITYLRLNSDVQEHAYVLKETEAKVPIELERAFTITNRLQDLLTAAFKTGRTGNEILALTIKNAKAEGIQPSIYSHPIGFHGHAAGPPIGMWDMQNGVPGAGAYKMRPKTCYSIELNAMHKIEGWNKPVRIALEQNGYFDGDHFDYIDGRQQAIHMIQTRD
jgi:hypothetical protein